MTILLPGAGQCLAPAKCEVRAGRRRRRLQQERAVIPTGVVAGGHTAGYTGHQALQPRPYAITSARCPPSVNENKSQCFGVSGTIKIELICRKKKHFITKFERPLFALPLRGYRYKYARLLFTVCDPGVTPTSAACSDQCMQSHSSRDISSVQSS